MIGPFATVQCSCATDSTNDIQHRECVFVVHYFAMMTMFVFAVMNFERVMQF